MAESNANHELNVKFSSRFNRITEPSANRTGLKCCISSAGGRASFEDFGSWKVVGVFEDLGLKYETELLSFEKEQKDPGCTRYNSNEMKRFQCSW